MKVKSESEVAQPCSTLSNPMDCSLPGSSVHGIFEARVLEWGAIAISIYLRLNQQFYQYSYLNLHINVESLSLPFSSVQLLGRVRLFVNP